MKKYILFLLIFIFNSRVLMCENDSSLKEINLKVNALHATMGYGLPSLHLECQIMKKQSINFAAYYLNYELIDFSSQGYGATMSYKYYILPLKTSEIKGLYVDLGFDLLNSQEVTSTGYSWHSVKNVQYYSVKTALGYKVTNKRFIFDIGAGVKVGRYESFPLVMIGFGYKIRK